LTTRRDFTAGLFLAAATRSAWAQAPAKQHRIVFVFGAGPTANWRENRFWQPFFFELRRLGYVEGNNLALETLTAEGHFERVSDVAHQAVSRNPAAIVAGEIALIVALKSATGSIPIVGFMSDPVDTGLASSLAHRPGDNLTGISEGGGELWGKRLQILKEAIPSASRIGLLAPLAVREWRLPSLQRVRDAAAVLGVSLIEMYPGEATAAAIERSFAALAEQRVDAVLIGTGALAAHSPLIVNLADRYRLPTMYGLRSPVEAGGLMAYVPDFAELGRQLADDVRQIFNGTKPGDIPIYQATKFELVINLKTANSLGLTFPRSLLLLADEVIE
jgi:putative ABC transport system substrate-binding protein